MRRYLLIAAAAVAVMATGPIAADGTAGAVVAGGRAGPGSRLWVAHFEAGARTLSDDMVVSPHGARPGTGTAMPATLPSPIAPTPASSCGPAVTIAYRG